MLNENTLAFFNDEFDLATNGFVESQEKRKSGLRKGSCGSRFLLQRILHQH